MKNVVQLRFQKNNFYYFLLTLSFNLLSEEIILPKYPSNPLINSESMLPFPVAPEFEKFNVNIPDCELPLEPAQYDKSHLIAWSGLNNNPAFLNSVNSAVKLFKDSGAEVKAFIPEEDLSDSRVLSSKNKDLYQKANSSDLINHIKQIAAEFRENQEGSKVGQSKSNRRESVTIFISNHGIQDNKTGNFWVHGPKNEKGETQAITKEMLGVIAKELKDFDVRFINGSCFGANVNDAFSQSYLRQRSQSGANSKTCSCEAALATYDDESFSFGSQIWEDGFVKPNSSGDSFLMASFKAASTTRIGRNTRVNKLEDGTELRGVASWNAALSGSERMLYYNRLNYHYKRSNLKFHFNKPLLVLGTDELSEKFFSMKDSPYVFEPVRDPKFAEIYKQTKLQTEEFVSRLNLDDKYKKFIGYEEAGGATGKINLERAKIAATDKEILSTFGYRNEALYNQNNELQTLKAHLYELNKSFKKDGTNKIMVHFYNPSKLMSKDDLEKDIKAIETKLDKEVDDGYYKMQLALALIKRLGLMLDFLNRPDEGDPMLAKQKKLFAWYRSCELQRLVPLLKDGAREPNLASSSGASSPRPGQSGKTHTDTRLKN